MPEKENCSAMQSSANPNLENLTDDRIEEEELRENMSKIKNKIVVLSGKGGVGKSTVAANLAVSLAEKKKKTGLLDVDIHGPSIPTLLGLKQKQLEITKSNKIMPIEYNNYLTVMSIGFMLPGSDDAVIWRGPLKYSLIKQFLKDVEWSELDYLIIDSPPGTGDEPLSICQLIENPKGAIVVTTPQDVALIDVRKSITFCKKLNMPIIGIVENMSGFICPHCGKKTDIFKTGGGEHLAKEMGIPYLGNIPIEPQIVTNADSGKSFLSNKSNNTTAENNFNSIVDKIIKGDNK